MKNYTREEAIAVMREVFPALQPLAERNADELVAIIPEMGIKVEMVLDGKRARSALFAVRVSYYGRDLTGGHAAHDDDGDYCLRQSLVLARDHAARLGEAVIYGLLGDTKKGGGSGADLVATDEAHALAAELFNSNHVM